MEQFLRGEKRGISWLRFRLELICVIVVVEHGVGVFDKFRSKIVANRFQILQAFGTERTGPWEAARWQ